MNEASSERRKRMGRAISSGDETRPSGVRFSSWSRKPGSSKAGASIGVSTAPGHTALTRKPSDGVALGERTHDPEDPTLRGAVGGEHVLPNSPSIDEMSTAAEPGPASTERCRAA